MCDMATVAPRRLQTATASDTTYYGREVWQKVMPRCNGYVKRSTHE